MADEVSQLTRSDFQSSVRNAKGPVIVVFTADWAKDAESYEAVLEDLVDEYGEEIDLFRVDVDDEGRLANDFHIADVPTFIGFYHGNVLYRLENDALDEPSDALEVANKLINLPGAAA